MFILKAMELTSFLRMVSSNGGFFRLPRLAQPSNYGSGGIWLFLEIMKSYPPVPADHMVGA